MAYAAPQLDLRTRGQGSTPEIVARAGPECDTIAPMGVLYDYFAAPSDEAAATTINRLGGPSSQKVMAVPDSKPAKRGLFSRKDPSPEPQLIIDESLPVYDTLSVKGIDPLVQLGTLEELLSGRPYDEVIGDPRSGNDLASANGGELLVLTITDVLAAALAGASDERLFEVAVPWSQTEEFWGQADPDGLAEFLRDFAALARRAERVNQRLYCWLCV